MTGTLEFDEELEQAMRLKEMIAKERKESEKGLSEKKQDKPKAQKTQKTRKEKPADKPKTDAVVTSDKVPELPRFKNLRRDIEIMVDLYQHSIKYKNQSWGIPGREVPYKLDLVRSTKEAKDIADKFTMDLSAESRTLERDRAAAGKVRYFKFVSYAENIPYKARELAYVRVYPSKAGGLKSKLMVLEKTCRDNNIGAGTIREKIDAELMRIESV